METHLKHLKSKCRICLTDFLHKEDKDKNKSKNKHNVSTISIHEQLKIYFFPNESEQLHPPYLCGKCNHKLKKESQRAVKNFKRTESGKKQKLDYDYYLSSIGGKESLFIQPNHNIKAHKDDDCEICGISKNLSSSVDSPSYSGEAGPSKSDDLCPEEVSIPVQGSPEVSSLSHSQDPGPGPSNLLADVAENQVGPVKTSDLGPEKVSIPVQGSSQEQYASGEQDMDLNYPGDSSILPHVPSPIQNMDIDSEELNDPIPGPSNTSIGEEKEEVLPGIRSLTKSISRDSVNIKIGAGKDAFLD